MFKEIQTLAYHVDADMLSHLTMWRLKVPYEWKRAVTSLSKARRSGKPASPPVRSLNNLLSYLLPDQIVAVHPKAWHIDADTHWVTAVEPVAPELLTRIVRAWLRRAYSTEGAALASNFHPSEILWEGPLPLQWEPNAAFLEQNNYWYSLIPHVVAMHLARVEQLSWDGHEITLRRVGGHYHAGELISWKPEHYRGTDPWSLRLRFRLETFADLEPRLHLHMGIRRWVREVRQSKEGTPFVDTKVNRTFYLARNAPWLDGSPERPVFMPVQFRPKWTKSDHDWTQQLEWKDSLLADVLEDLSIAPLPDLDEILMDLPAARQGHLKDGELVAALLYHQQGFESHRVRPGMSVKDRAELFHSISTKLGFLTPVAPCPRHPTGQASGNNWLRQKGKIPADVRREAVVQTLGPSPRILAFYQTEAVRDALQAVLHEETGGGVVMEPIPLGELGSPLSVEGSQRNDIWEAVRQRSHLITRSASAWAATGIKGAFVELKWIKDATDPKAAIRLGLAEAGMVSQFLLPPEKDEQVSSIDNRATGAVRDLLRQLGVMLDRPLPEMKACTLPSMSILGLTTIAKKRDRKGYKRYGETFLPMLVWMHTDTKDIRVHFPGAEDWMDYPTAAIELAGRAEVDWYHNKAELNRWLEDVLLEDVLPEGKALLLVDAYRTRNWWSWLSNQGMELDHLQFGEKGRLRTPVHDSLWSSLRIVRLRPGDSMETAQWFGVGKKAGVPHGLFQLTGRTFLSAQERPASARKSLRTVDSKIERPGKNGWLPRLMEATVVLNGPEDDPAQWAAAAHHLRRMLSHHKEAVILPLPLHLAKGLGAYALPLPSDENERD